MLNMDQAEGRFTQMKGKIKATWGKLTDNDILLYKGQHEQFLGKLKDHYGLAKEAAEKQLKVMEDAFDPKLQDGADGAARSTAAQTSKAMPGVAK
jgi:uncharacterized protein YjbJ (UPF0337 family)